MGIKGIKNRQAYVVALGLLVVSFALFLYSLFYIQSHHLKHQQQQTGLFIDQLVVAIRSTISKHHSEFSLLSKNLAGSFAESKHGLKNFADSYLKQDPNCAVYLLENGIKAVIYVGDELVDDLQFIDPHLKAMTLLRKSSVEGRIIKVNNAPYMLFSKSHGKQTLVLLLDWQKVMHNVTSLLNNNSFLFNIYDGVGSNLSNNDSMLQGEVAYYELDTVAGVISISAQPKSGWNNHHVLKIIFVESGAWLLLLLGLGSLVLLINRKLNYPKEAALQQSLDAQKTRNENMEVLLHTIPVPLVVTSTSTGEVLFANSYASEIFKQELDGYVNAIDFYVNPEVRNLFLTRLMDEHRVDNFELEMRRATGEHFWARASAVLFQYEGKQSVLSTIRDITAKKITEQALQRSEETLRKVFEQVPNPMAITLQKDGLVKRLNEAAVEFFGVRDVLNTPLRATDYYVNVEDRTRLFERLQKKGYVDDFELQMHNHQGKLFTLLMSAVKLELDGEPALLTSFANITERKKMESELKAAMEKAQEAIRAKNEFLATMSHEIRTPLNGALSMAKLLAESELTPKQQEYVDAINYSGDALLTILTDILDFSRLEAGMVELEYTNFNVGNLIDEIVGLMAIKATDHENTLSVNIDSEVPDYLIGDSARVRQVMFNLVGNAIKFTNNGSVTVNVNKRGQVGHKYSLRFEVVDTGIGIDKKQRAHLFDSFTQADSSINRTFGGSGLGLAICQRMVTMMGGEIGVDSRPGEGSTFWFEIELEEGQAVSANDTKILDNKKNRMLNILLVEDDEISQKAQSALLTKEGHQVDIASDGYEALNILNSEVDLFSDLYDLILMDIHMPKMNGIETSRCIRKLDEHMAQIPIIALTADVTKENIEACKDAGIDRLITKPINMSELNSTIEEVINSAMSS